MNRWTVKRIVAKDGTVFPAWRVQDPRGNTVRVTHHRLLALDTANKLAWWEAFCGVINTTWGTKIGGQQS